MQRSDQTSRAESPAPPALGSSRSPTDGMVQAFLRRQFSLSVFVDRTPRIVPPHAAASFRESSAVGSTPPAPAMATSPSYARREAFQPPMPRTSPPAIL